MTPKERKKYIKSKGLTHLKIAKMIYYNRTAVTSEINHPKTSHYRIQRAIADAIGVNFKELWG